MGHLAGYLHVHSYASVTELLAMNAVLYVLIRMSLNRRFVEVAWI